MHGDARGHSRPRRVMTLAHVAGVVVAVYLVSKDGVSAREGVVLACSVAYLLRYFLTCFYLLRRGVDWSEAAQVGPLLFAVQTLFGYLASRCSAPLGWLDWIAVGLYVLGSILNTGSEFQRRHWKANPANSGHLYRGGLFSLSMHINYFGDVLLFTGFALVTGSAWALLVPLVMLILFVSVHIPMLDTHLAKKYPEEFAAWSKESKKLVPFLY